MTYYKDVWIMCDGCGRDWNGAARTATKARQMMRDDDWVNRGSEDYCPECK